MKEINAFIQQGHNQLIKRQSKTFIMLEKISISNKCYSFELLLKKNPKKL